MADAVNKFEQDVKDAFHDVEEKFHHDSPDGHDDQSGQSEEKPTSTEPVSDTPASEAPATPIEPGPVTEPQGVDANGQANAQQDVTQTSNADTDTAADNTDNTDPLKGEDSKNPQDVTDEITKQLQDDHKAMNEAGPGSELTDADTSEAWANRIPRPVA